MATRKPIDPRAIGLMVVLCLVWAFGQVALKATALDVPALMQVALRSGMAAVLVAGLMALRGERMSPLRDRTLRPGIVVGSLFALEFLLVSEGLRHTSAAHMVVFLYTAPIFAALGLHRWLPAERLRPLQWAGIALAFVGIAVAFFGGAQPQPGAAAAVAAAASSATAAAAATATTTAGVATAAATVTNTLWGDALGLAGGMAWGATTVVLRTSTLANAPATQTLLYQLVAAFIWLLPAALFTGQAHFAPTPLALASMAFQVVIVTFASFLVWFWLLRHYLASQLGVFSFMTPMFGVALGAWLLHEPLEPRFITGSALVLSGIVLVNGAAWLTQVVSGVKGRAGSRR